MDDYTAPEFGRSALLTIDLQRDFAGIPGTTEILPAVRRLLAAYRSARLPIVHVVRLYLPDGSNADLSRRALIRSGTQLVAPGTDGANLLTEEVDLDADLLIKGQLQRIGDAEYVLYKPRWSAFYQTLLLDHLRIVRRRPTCTVVVAGCNYPNCPRSTLIDATQGDLRAVAVQDAISRWTPTAADELADLGVAVHTTKEVIAAIS
jgi:nicotinamidase-related amidase